MEFKSFLRETLVADENLIIGKLAKIVARFNANSDRANLKWGGVPSFTVSSLGVRPCKAELAGELK